MRRRRRRWCGWTSRFGMYAVSPVGRERPHHLPPLETNGLLWDDSTTECLGRSMAELSFEIRSPATSPTGTNTTERRAMRGISCFGHRANERAAEADVEIAAHDRASSEGFHLTGGFDTLGGAPFSQILDKQQQTFEQIVSKINAAFDGKTATPTKIVHQDDSVTDTVPLHGTQQYRVPLPSRPIAVVVTVKVTSGPRCTVWGSTSCEKPSPRNYDWKGKDEKGDVKLVYDHIDQRGEDDDGHRGHQVPPARCLWLSVEAVAGEVCYRLSVGFMPIKVTLNRLEGKVAQKTRRGWECKLADLHKDPAAREHFEDRVKQLKERRKLQLQEESHGVDYVDKNTNIQGYRDQRVEALQRRSTTRKERHVKALETKEELERQQESQSLAWLARAEARRMERESRELAERATEERLDRQRRWFVHLACVGFAARTSAGYIANRSAFEMDLRRRGAANIIRKYVIRILTRRRRHNLYKNKIRFRLCMATYVRMMRPAICTASQPKIRQYLETHQSHKEVPSLRGALDRFRMKVVRMQRMFRQVMLIRRAYVKLFMEKWLRYQNQIFMEKINAEEERLLGSKIGEEEKKQDHTAPARSRISTTESCRNSGGASIDMSEFTERTAKDMPSEFMARTWLFEYIRNMQKDHPRRVKVWEASMQNLTVQKDLQNFGIDTEDLAEKGPTKKRAVYLDQAELEALVRTKVAEWLGGGFKVEKAHRRRLLSPAFEAWELWTRAKIQGSSFEEMKKARRARLRRQSQSQVAMRRPTEQSAHGSLGSSPLRKSTRKSIKGKVAGSAFLAGEALLTGRQRQDEDCDSGLGDSSDEERANGAATAAAPGDSAAADLAGDAGEETVATEGSAINDSDTMS